MRQKTAQAELPLESRGEAPRVQRSGEARTAANGNERSGTATLMERVVERGNVQAALKRVRQNQGQPRRGRDDRRRAAGVPGGELGAAFERSCSRAPTSRKPVREVEIPKSGGGVRKLGIPDGARPVDPAEHPAGAAADVRPHLLRAQLRLPAWAQCTPGGVPGAALHPGGKTGGGGRGPGEVLRPGQPRRADGQAGKADRGQADAGADPPLPGGRRHGRTGW